MAGINPQTVVCDRGPHAHNTSSAAGKHDVFYYFNRIDGVLVPSANNINININTNINSNINTT